MPRLSSKNQITVPVKVLEETGIEPGDELRVEAGEPGEIRVRRAESWADEVIRRHAGSMPPGTYPPGAAGELRREWDRLR